MDQFKQFVRNALTGDGNSGKKMYFGAISGKLAERIGNATNLSVDGYNLSLGENEIRKIQKSHGNEAKESARGQRAVTESDFLNIPNIIQTADEITRSKTDYNGKPAIEFRKKNGNEVTTVVAVVSDKRLDVFVQTEYINKKSGSIATPESVQADSFTPEAPGGTAPKTEVMQSADANIPGATSETEATVTSNKSIAQGGTEVKGTGAAEQNFSGKAQYQELLTDENAQPDRATDARPMEVPKTDANGNPVSEVAANVYGSKFTPDDLASEIEGATARGELSYMKVTNDQAAEKARAKIEDAGGWDAAYTEFHDSVREGITSAEMAARGAMLLNHAADVYEQTKATGDEAATKAAKQKWISVLLDVREMGTNTAQGLQAMRMIRELAPPDKLDFAVASVKRMVSNMKLGNSVKIDEKLINEYRMADTDEQRAEIMGRIQQNVADQIPSTFLDKWTALRYMNMLGNLKTNVRNVGGNVGSAIAYRIKDQVAATIEDIVSTLDPNYQRTKTHTVSAKALEFAKKDFEQVKAAVNSGGKFNERMASSDDFQQGVMDKRKVFDSKILEGYRKGTNWMMNNKYFGDEAFGRGAYARALAGYLKANGVKDADLSSVDPAMLDKARAYAIKEAQEATFKDNSALANIATKIKNATGVVGEGIMPFTKTPANVLVRATEFSPLGILDTAYKAVKAANPESEVTGADVINSLAKGMTGAGLVALGALLYDQGWLSAGESSDEEEAELDELTGKQPYSLMFTTKDGEKKSYTMDWVTPIAMPMFMGAELWEAIKEKDGKLSFSDLEEVFTSIADPMVQMSMLQGLNDSLDSIKYVDNNLGQFFINSTLNFLTQGITNTLLGQIERSTEENRMTTYTDENSGVPKWLQKTIGKASQKIPGWDYQQTEYRNRMGKTEKNEGGLLYNVASPGYLETERNSAITDELYRLNGVVEDKVVPPEIPTKITYTDTSGNLHEDYQLTQKQYKMLADRQGKIEEDVMGRLFNNSSYKNLTDAQKAATIDAVYQYAKEKGIQTAIGSSYYSKADSWIANTRESDIDAFITQGSKTVLNKVIENAVNASVNNWTVSVAAKSDMEKSWNAFDKMPEKTKQQILDEVSSEVSRYLESREGGVSTNSFLAAEKSVSKLGQNPKAGQKYSAVADTKGVIDAAMDALMKAYMDDYDPESKSPNTTELKYDYARKELGLTPKQFAQAYSVSTEDGKKTEKYAQWASQGYTPAQQELLWNLFKSTSEKTKIDVVAWHEKQ